MLTYYFKKNRKQPKYKQLYVYIRSEIENGNIKENMKLPSKRKLASHLKVSQATIDIAYQQLVVEGYIRSIPKSGFYVEHYQKPIISKKEFVVQEEMELKKTSNWCDFKTNVVDPTLFPHLIWAKLSRMVLIEHTHSMVNDVNAQGIYPLRIEIAKYLHAYRGVDAKPEQIIIGAGSETLIQMLINLLGRKKTYAYENPGYPKIRRIFSSNELVTIPIGLDDDGLIVKELERMEASIVHVTPSHQFPLGIVMPMKRRQELLQWASKKPQRYIIEDDYDSEFRFSGQPIPALQSMDYAQKVIYINSFTKSIAPSLRINYMVLPEILYQRFQDLLGYQMCSVPSFDQWILYRFMKEGYFERHLNRMRNAYRLRLQSILNAIEEHQLQDIITLKGYDAGLHFLMTVNNGMDEASLIQSAKEHGILLHGLSEYFNPLIDTMPQHTLVMGYSSLDSDKIGKAIGVFKKIWQKR